MNELVHDSMSMSVSTGLHVHDVLCLCGNGNRIRERKEESCPKCRWQCVPFRYDSLCYQRPLPNTLNRK